MSLIFSLCLKEQVLELIEKFNKAIQSRILDVAPFLERYQWFVLLYRDFLHIFHVQLRSLCFLLWFCENLRKRRATSSLIWCERANLSKMSVPHVKQLTKFKIESHGTGCSKDARRINCNTSMVFWMSHLSSIWFWRRTSWNFNKISKSRYVRHLSFLDTLDAIWSYSKLSLIFLVVSCDTLIRFSLAALRYKAQK